MESAQGVRGQASEAARAGPAEDGRADPRGVRSDGRRTGRPVVRQSRRRDARPPLAVGRDERALGADGRRTVRGPGVADAHEQTERRVRHGRRTAQPDTVGQVCGARGHRLLARHPN